MGTPDFSELVQKIHFKISMQPKKEIILLGGGGHCVSAIEVIESTEMYKIIGVLDVKEKIGNKILGYEIIGTDNNLNEYKSVKNFCITVGQIKSSQIRQKLYNAVIEIDGVLPTIIASSAYISKYTKIGKGNLIMHQTFVNAGVQIGDNNIINTQSIIEHESIIGNHNHISTGAIINADCKIGNKCFIGSNSVINRDLEITDDVIIGSGSVVTKKIEEKGIYFGNPCKFVD